jgi:phytanoyl-CoA hydroxylase
MMPDMHSQPNILDASQIATYREQGFLHLGRILDEADLANLRLDEARLRNIRLQHDAGSPGTVFRHQICAQSPAVRAQAVAGKQIAAVRQLLGCDDVVFWYTQFVTKLADGGSGASTFPWHQDRGYLDVEPDTVTVWTPLDDVDERNGCIWVVPGSHRRGLLPHGRPHEANWHLTTDVPERGTPVPLKAGHAIAFSGLTLHRSLGNGSGAPRRAFFLEYARASAVATAERQPLVVRPHAWVVSGAAPLLP